MYEFMGIPLIEDIRLPEFTPIIELSNNINVSNEFRVKTNKWYLEMFGEKRTMYMAMGKYIAHPKTIVALKKTMS